MADKDVIDFSSVEDSGVYDDLYTQHAVWNKIDINTISIINSDRYFGLDQNDLSCEDLSFEITLVRRPLYFMMNNVFPCLILNFVVILLFTLPFGMQVGACK